MPSLIPRIFSIFRKFANFRKMVKISFWHRFKPLLPSKSKSPCKALSIHRPRSLFYRFFKNSIFWKPVFAYFWTFEWYFRPRERSHRIRREKRPGGLILRYFGHTVCIFMSIFVYYYQSYIFYSIIKYYKIFYNTT